MFLILSSQLTLFGSEKLICPVQVEEDFSHCESNVSRCYSTKDTFGAVIIRAPASIDIGCGISIFFPLLFSLCKVRFSQTAAKSETLVNNRFRRCSDKCIIYEVTG